MKKLKLLILALFVLSTCNTMAQQLPNVSYFMYDYTRTNPGSLGSKDMICASLIGKTLMQGFVDNGAPSNAFASIDAPFRLFGVKHGIGLSFYTDQLGFYNDFNIKLGYAYRFNVADGTLGIGINGNFRQKGLEKVNWIEGANTSIASDPYIPSGDQKNITGFGAGFGLFYRSEDIYLGASVSNIYSSEFVYESSGSGSPTQAKETIRPHYYVMAGYNFQLSNPAYEIEPAVQIYSEGTSTTFDLNGTLTYNKRIWAGVSYRAGAAVVGMLGFTILEDVRVGYAYDYNTSALSKYSSGNHEVLISYCFKVGVEKSPQRYRSIRYL